MASKDSPASSTRPSPTTNTKANRLPAPTLFVGPPSRNASQLSVSRQANDPSFGKPHRDPLSRQKSALNRQHEPDSALPEQKDSNTTPAIKKSSEKDIDAKWREMQSTLNEVELTAQSSTHVFGESHAAALDDLRKAQVELAQAWGKGNEENAQSAAENATHQHPPEVHRFQGADDLAADRREKQRTRRGRARGDTATSSASTNLSDESTATTGTTSTSGGGAGSRSVGGQLEDETAADIRLASERRAANEAYFRKVDEGVREVVRKLEVVAEAMRGVEGESRSLWSESSTTTGTTTGSMEGGRGEVGAEG